MRAAHQRIDSPRRNRGSFTRRKRARRIADRLDSRLRGAPHPQVQPSADASPSHGGSQPHPKGPLETSDQNASLPRPSPATVPSPKPRPKNYPAFFTSPPTSSPS